jgi:hypothetical protein
MCKKEPSKVLYIFIDESGNFDFTEKGTKYFILTGFVTFNPVINREKLLSLKYELLASGYDQKFFHATSDRQIVRNKVYDFIFSIKDLYEFYSVIARKNKTPPSLYGDYKNGKLVKKNKGFGLYKVLCENLLQGIFTGRYVIVDEIVVVMSSLFEGEKRKVLLKTLKNFLKNNLDNIPFQIYDNSSESDLNCQLVDYCCWALFRKYENTDLRSYERIKDCTHRREFEIFHKEDEEYY